VTGWGAGPHDVSPAGFKVSDTLNGSLIVVLKTTFPTFGAHFTLSLVISDPPVSPEKLIVIGFSDQSALGDDREAIPTLAYAAASTLLIKRPTNKCG